MKKLLTVLSIMVSLLLVSCAEDPEVNINKVSEEMNYKGGTLVFDVTSNCDWELLCDSDDQDLLTVSQWTGGAGTHTITVDVEENESNSILKHYFTAVAHGAKRDAITFVTLTQGAPAYVLFNKSTFNTDYIGGKYKFTVSSNFPWKITVEGEGITVEPTSGLPLVEEDEDPTAPAQDKDDDEDDPNTITVTIDEYEGDTPRTFLLHVTAQGEDKVVEDELVITQESPALMIGNREYRIKKMADGRWWMIDNLCYSNKGITIGDGICGVWYPSSETANESDNAEASIIEKGLLYSDAVTFNVSITKTSAKKQEGAQGICPAGWHIPTLKEYMALVGKCKNSKVQTVTDAPFYDAARDCGSLSMLKEAGFVDKEAGYILGVGAGYSKGFRARKANRTYFYCSNLYAEKQWYALMLNESDNTANVDYMYNYISDTPYAGSVRCIKDIK